MLRQRLFALDCVTFQADTRKINPAPWTDRAGDSGHSSCPGQLHIGLLDQRWKEREKRENRDEEKESSHRPHTAIPHVYLWAGSLESLDANTWLWMHSGSRTDLLMRCLRRWPRTAELLIELEKERTNEKRKINRLHAEYQKKDGIQKEKDQTKIQTRSRWWKHTQ